MKRAHTPEEYYNKAVKGKELLIYEERRGKEMKKTKKLLAFVLASAMMVSNVAYAAPASGEPSESVQQVFRQILPEMKQQAEKKQKMKKEQALHRSRPKQHSMT